MGGYLSLDCCVYRAQGEGGGGGVGGGVAWFHMYQAVRAERIGEQRQ